MDKIIALLLFVVSAGVAYLAFPHGASAVLLLAVCVGLGAYIFRFFDFDADEKVFLRRVFLLALIARVLYGALTFLYLPTAGANDSFIYDQQGQRMIEYWYGYPMDMEEKFTQRALSTDLPGWGMTYVVAFIYVFVGFNIFAVQFFCSFLGAATAILTYICSFQVFNNKRVAKISALFVAFFPALIIWSSQAIKDGILVFLLVFTMIAVMRLQRKFNYFLLAGLIFALFGVLTLRFYIFYMLATAVVGSFLIGSENTFRAFLQRSAMIVLVGVGLTFFGFYQRAATEIENYGSLERIEVSRKDLATSAESGYGEDLDVSTTEGAIQALPIGLAYLLLAPFPWDVKNLRQAGVLPEMLLWWSMIPLLVSGIWYTFKNRLRSAAPILMFTFMLTLSYAIFLGNVGTAYRQRTQIQVFFVMFIAVGWVLWQEKKENRKMMREALLKRQLKRINVQNNF